MGLSIGTLTKIILGFGLGILTVSCLTVTILFGQYANKGFTQLEKIEIKVGGGPRASIIDCSIAIAVLGCISAVVALAAIVLSIILESQPIILIIAGGVSALFAFGCIVAEGVFTLKTVQMNNPFHNGPNNSAQKYIKKAIEELYKQGYNTLLDQYPETQMPDWTNVTNTLGKEVSDSYSSHIFTYNDLWNNDGNPNYISIYIYGDTITAKFEGHSVDVASINFIYKGSITEKIRACWLNKKVTDFSCTNIKVRTDKNYPVNLETEEMPYLDQNIVVGSYISPVDANNNDINVNYNVYHFPIAYKLISTQEYKDKENDDNEIDGYEDSTNHYKYTGKKLAKAAFNEFKKSSEKVDKNENLILVPKKPKNYKDLLSMCNWNDEDEGGENLYNKINKKHKNLK